jgi:hypothetical protein
MGYPGGVKALPAQASATAQSRAFGQQGEAKRSMVVPEPTVGVGMQTGRPYFTLSENRPELIQPRGQGMKIVPLSDIALARELNALRTRPRRVA